MALPRGSQKETRQGEAVSTSHVWRKSPKKNLLRTVSTQVQTNKDIDLPSPSPYR